MSSDEQIASATASAYTNAIANHRASIAEVAVALDPTVCESSGKALKGRVVVVTGEPLRFPLHNFKLIGRRYRRRKWFRTSVRDQGSRVWGQGRLVRRERPCHRRHRHLHPSLRWNCLCVPYQVRHERLGPPGSHVQACASDLRTYRCRCSECGYWRDGRMVKGR